MLGETWRGTGILPAYSAACARSLPAMADRLSVRFDDPWVGGQRIDSYVNWWNRGDLKDMLQRAAKTAAEAEEYRRVGKEEKAFDKWTSLFRKEFPAAD